MISKKVFPNPESLAQQAALDISNQILSGLKSNGTFSLVITGGGIGIATLKELAQKLQGKDLYGLSIWFSDERYLSSLDPQRNAVQARTAFERISSANYQLHEFPASDSGDIFKAAEKFAESTPIPPAFDLVLLGMGEDGHVASVFPNSNANTIAGWLVVERSSPKPPPQRLSLSLQTICAAKQVWFLVAGKEKAATLEAVFRKESSLPAAKVSGVERTVWYLDEAATSSLPL